MLAGYQTVKRKEFSVSRAFHQIVRVHLLTGICAIKQNNHTSNESWYNKHIKPYNMLCALGVRHWSEIRVHTQVPIHSTRWTGNTWKKTCLLIEWRFNRSIKRIDDGFSHTYNPLQGCNKDSHENPLFKKFPKASNSIMAEPIWVGKMGEDLSSPN